MQTPEPSTRLTLTNEPALGHIQVDLEAFFEYSFWLAEELEDLVAKWRHVTPTHVVPRS